MTEREVDNQGFDREAFGTIVGGEELLLERVEALSTAVLKMSEVVKDLYVEINHLKEYLPPIGDSSKEFSEEGECGDDWRFQFPNGGNYIDGVPEK